MSALLSRAAVPSVAERRLLIAALASGERAREAYAAWRREVDWADIPDASQRLLSILHDNLTRNGIADEVLDRIRGVRRYRWARNLRTMAVAKRVHAAFARAGVRAMALKGSALVASRYTDRSIRPMEDLDVLVEEAQLDAALAALAAIGMRPRVARTASLRARIPGALMETGWPIADEDTGGPDIDLHWRALHLDRRPDADAATWTRARTVDFEGTAMIVPHPLDLAIQIAVNGAKGAGRAALPAVADLAIVTRATPGFDWGRLVEIAAEHRVSTVIAEVFGLLAEVTGEAGAARVAERLRAVRDPALVFERRLEDAAWDTPSRFGGAALVAIRRRRSTPALFHGSLVGAIVPAARELAGTRGTGSAVARLAYLCAPRILALRRALACDARLRLPPAEALAEPSGAVDLTQDELPESHFVTGWSLAEAGGRWTSARAATLAFRRHSARGEIRSLLFDATPALHPRHEGLVVDVIVADRPVGRYRFGFGQAAGPIACEVPRARAPFRDVVPVTFEIDHPFVPKSAGISDDRRALGLFLRRIEIGTA